MEVKNVTKHVIHIPPHACTQVNTQWLVIKLATELKSTNLSFSFLVVEEVKINIFIFKF